MAATSLGYTPNGAARALKSHRHGAIAVLMFGLGGSAEPLTFYSEAVVAAAEEALRSDHHVVLLQAHGRSSDPADPARKGALSHVLAAARVDGAVCIGTQVTADDVRVMERRGFPFIFIGKRVLPGVTVPYVATDYLGGGRLAVDHLLGLGHRCVAAAVIPSDREQPWIAARLTGHAVAISETPGASGPVVQVPPVSSENAGVARKWLADGITAVFATERNTAARVLGLCQLAGVQIPAELAVVGFDDHTDAVLVQPPLTVVKQALASLGTLAARTLLARLDGAPHEPVSATLPTSLVVRESCGAHAAQAASVSTTVGPLMALNGAATHGGT